MLDDGSLQRDSAHADLSICVESVCQLFCAVVTVASLQPEPTSLIRLISHLSQHYYASALGGHFATARSVRLSVPWRSCLGYRHAGCLQLSHRPTRDVRTADPSADGRRSAAVYGSNCYRRGEGGYRLAAAGATPCFLLPVNSPMSAPVTPSLLAV